MASVQGTHVFSVNPYITCKVNCSTKREGKSIYARWRSEVSALTNGSFPYSINLTIVMNEVRLADVVQLKATSPSTWSNPIITYYPSSTGWVYIGDITDTSISTLPVRVRYTASSGLILHLEGEESITPFSTPTAPTSVSASLQNVGSLNTSFRLSWSGYQAGTGEITGYYIQYKIGVNGSWYSFTHGGGTSANVSLSSLISIARGSTVYFRVAVADEYGYQSSYSTSTASVYYVDYPDAPTNVQSSVALVAETSDNFTLSWTRPNADVGSISAYDIYYQRSGSWVFLKTVYALTASINLSSINPNRGSTVYFAITAVDSFGLESEISSNTAGIKLANLPTAPTWINVDQQAIKTNDRISVTFGGATSQDGEIAYYTLQYRLYDGTSWSEWNDAEYLTETSCNCMPSMMFPNLKNGDMLDARVATVSELGLQSSSYRKINDLINIVGGGVRVWINGRWVEGTAYVRSSGAWKQSAIYVRHNGAWKEGI